MSLREPKAAALSREIRANFICLSLQQVSDLLLYLSLPDCGSLQGFAQHLLEIEKVEAVTSEPSRPPAMAGED